MARNQRRSTRSNPQKSPLPSPLSEKSLESPTNFEAATPDSRPKQSEEETCPACKEEEGHELNNIEKESWVRCDACKTWYHWRCAGNGGDLATIDKWFCKDCIEADAGRVVTFKLPARKSSRKRAQRDYANLNSGLESDPNRWLRILEGKSIKEDSFRRMKGDSVTIEWLHSDDNAMREPIVIEHPDGLGMKMPSKDLSVNDVAEIVGEDVYVEVIDVASQSNSPGWTLRNWADYYNLDPSARDKIRNVISLEISGTRLADHILPPRLVRDLDWVDKFWPSTRRGKGHPYPKVQLYCLMSVANAWTDWHIDFAGSSVYYHVLRGSKVFYLIRPTPVNLAAYERWSGTEIQNYQWLGDMTDEVLRVTLHEGNTMFIPTGWIHAVYTPVDSLVFGGNFLHSYNVSTQLKVREIELTTRVPKKFTFPLFEKLCWYVGDKYLRDLKAKEEFPMRVLESLEALSDFLVSEVRTMERGTEHAKRDSKEQVPSDRVKDPAAMARELRWRVRLARGQTSDDEGPSQYKKQDGNNALVENGMKRKRFDSNGSQDMFRNFKPKVWEKLQVKNWEDESQERNSRRPESEDGLDEQWLEWKEKDEGIDGDNVTVNRRREVIVKARRTTDGIQRQKVERVVEDWVWNHPSSKMMVDS